MKINLLLVFLFVFSTSLISQQNCNSYFTFTEGSYSKQHTYDKKGKLEGIVSHEVKSLTTTANGYLAEVEMILTDDKGEELSQSVYEVECADGNLIMDLSSRMFYDQSAAYAEEMDIDLAVESSGLVLPASLNVGDELEDAFYETKISSSGMVLMTTRMELTNRKVEGRETIETPAGTFECMVLSSTMESKAMVGSMEFQMKEWYAEGKGIVRSETYRRGKLDSYSELVEYRN